MRNVVYRGAATTTRTATSVLVAATATPTFEGPYWEYPCSHMADGPSIDFTISVLRESYSVAHYSACNLFSFHLLPIHIYKIGRHSEPHYGVYVCVCVRPCFVMLWC